MKLGEIFKNGLIFQHGKPIRVFGESDGAVKLTFAGNEQILSGGKWVAVFPSMDYGGPYALTVVGDGETVVVSDIYIGEVVLFSGQSNIQFKMKDGAILHEPLENDNMLRIFVSERLEQGEPFHPSNGWVKADIGTLGNWSAVAYQTGRAIRKRGKPAVGVVVCSQGASVIQSWMDEKLLIGSALDIPIAKRHPDSKEPDYSAWNANGTLFHFMLERLFPFSFGKVVWYQGESNASVAEGEIYDRLLHVMISNWRECFRDPMLGFIIVQIADFIHFRDQAGWKAVQDAQIRAAKQIPGVKTILSADVCENDTIHPMTKWKLAARIAENV